MSVIEACYIFDEHNNLILEHIYTGHPPPPSTLLPLYLNHESPRPSLLYLTATTPPTLLYSITQDNLLFLTPSTTDTDPLTTLEFLHRLADALSEFLGSPLLSTKLTSNHAIASQILSEITDSGIPSSSEANALRDVIETGPGVLKNLLGGVGISGQQASLTAQGSAVPWRRSNVRHTSNELYVDIVETLSVTLAPSGRALAAFACGSVVFTSRVSGVPDLLLTLGVGKGGGGGGRGEVLRGVMERMVFHPCVRLNRWMSEGVLSFVPPDGRFALCGYETDLLGPDVSFGTDKYGANSLDLPAKLEMTTGLGSVGNVFEVRVNLPVSSGARSAAAASLQSNLTKPGAIRAGSSGDSKAPTFEYLVVRVPTSTSVRNISDLRPSRGEAQWSAADNQVEWRIASKDLGPGGAVLRCTIQGPISDEDVEDSTGNGLTSTTYDYDDDQPSSYQSNEQCASGKLANGAETTDERRAERNKELMPTSATLSFSVKGWLASGIKVESLLLDTKKSRGLGPEVKPYKGVKYLTVSKNGIEIRC